METLIVCNHESNMLEIYLLLYYPKWIMLAVLIESCILLSKDE